MNRFVGIAAGVAALLSMTGSASGQSASSLPEDIKPMRMSGVGLNVKDIERQKAFYTDIVGFKVIARVPAKDGTAKEYLLGLTGSLTTDTLIVLTATSPATGSTSFGRIVLVVPSGRRMAERIAAAGGRAPKIADGVNIVYDPEGNMIELYQRPAPKAVG